MNQTTIVVLATVAIGVVAAIWAVLRWNSRRSTNFLMRGVGIILMATGAALVGLTAQVVNWLSHLTRLDTITVIGIALAVLGVVVYFIGGAIKVPTKQEAELREYQRQAKQREIDAKLAAKAAREDVKRTRASTNEPPQPESSN